MIGIICEGRYDRETIKILCKRIGVDVELRIQRGRINVRKACSFARELIRRGCSKVIILSDANCKEEEEERKRLSGIYEICKDIKDKIHICVVVSELESWLIADDDTLSNLLGPNIKVKGKIKNPEEIHAKDELIKLCKRAGKDYDLIMRELAKRIDIKAVLKKCKSFKNFYNLLQDCC